MWTWWRKLLGEHVEPPPVRWALIYTHQFALPAIRLITEDRIQIWEASGWTLLCRDSDIRFADVDDVRLDDERGRR